MDGLPLDVGSGLSLTLSIGAILALLPQLFEIYLKLPEPYIRISS